MTIKEAAILKAKKPEYWYQFDDAQRDYMLECLKGRKIDEKALTHILKVIGGLKREEM